VTTRHQSLEQAAIRGLLQAVGHHLGHPLSPEWVQAAHAVKRHRFLPERLWLNSGDGSYAPCELQQDSRRWFAAAYADNAVVTQVNDGAEPEEDDVWPSSSASAPSMVFRMLEYLDLADGMQVLEIGTGTGWNCALMAHRLGGGNVVSIEVDAQVAADARANLNACGLAPTVVHADGSEGWPPAEPYDRIISTCSVRSIPPAWITQSRPGGRIVTAWDNPWITFGLLTLDVVNGAASGRFHPHGAFMLIRGQRTDLRVYRDVVRDHHQPAESCTTLDPDLVAGPDVSAQFAIGVVLGDVWHAWENDPDVEGVKARLWISNTEATSWSAIDWDGTEEAGRYTVWQYGPRRLWEEVERAFSWWTEAGSPLPERFGITVDPHGHHRYWLDSPDQFLPTED
jgi:protein-L-isoaspartate O-methyltransferase